MWGPRHGPQTPQRSERPGEPVALLDPLLDLVGTIFASKGGMARPEKRPVQKAEPAKVSRKMRNVRPLRGTPAIGRRYDPGFKEPPEKSPWVDEGRPELGGD